MEIRNQSIYNKDLIVSYNNFYLKSYMKKNFLVISIISISFIIYMLIIKEWLYALFLAGVLALYFVLTYFMQKLTTKRILKKSPLVENPVLQSYVFRDNDFQVTVSETYTVPYDVIVKAKQGQDFFLLRSNDRKTFLITYAGFESEEDRKKLAEFFSNRFNMKIKDIK